MDVAFAWIILLLIGLMLLHLVNTWVTAARIAIPTMVVGVSLTEILIVIRTVIVTTAGGEEEEEEEAEEGLIVTRTVILMVVITGIGATAAARLLPGVDVTHLITGDGGATQGALPGQSAPLVVEEGTTMLRHLLPMGLILVGKVENQFPRPYGAPVAYRSGHRQETGGSKAGKGKGRN